MGRTRVVGAFALALAAGQVLSSHQPTFRAGVDYVRVDVVVTDKNDKPIMDLTKDDFTILEHGRPQSIDALQFVSVPIRHRPIDALVADTPPGEVATNASPPQNSRVFVLVVDDHHVVESQIVAVKKIMTDFIEALSPDDEVGIVFTGHSNLSQNVTTDRLALANTIGRVRDALGFGLDAYGRPNGSAQGAEGRNNGDPSARLTTSLDSRTRSNVSNLFTLDKKIMRDYARETDIVLKNVADALAGSNHTRRAIVYVSSGSILPTVPRAGDQLTDYEWLTEVYEASHRADVPIYTIDPRGRLLPEDAVRGGIGAISSEVQRAIIAANIRQQVDRLSEVAVNTGGRAFTGQSNLTRAVREIVADNGSYYVLGYHPAPFEVDGQFHTISVRVGRPGARVRARAGYVAPRALVAADVKSTLDAAMSVGTNVSDLAIRAVAAPVTLGTKGMRTVVTVEVSYPVPADGPRHIDDTLQMNVIALDPDAKVKASSERTLHFANSAQGGAPVMFLIDDVLDLPSQPLTLRVGVASRAIGKAGTVQFPLDIPKPSERRLQLSGIVVGLANSPRETAISADVPTDLIPFQPTTTRVFKASDTLRVYSRASWGVDGSAATVTLTLDGATTIPAKTTTVTSSRRTDGRCEATFDSTLPLTSVLPGRYVLTIHAQLTNGESARKAISFEVQ